jgi:hypothetical protein
MEKSDTFTQKEISEIVEDLAKTINPIYAQETKERLELVNSMNKYLNSLSIEESRRQVQKQAEKIRSQRMMRQEQRLKR